MYFLFQRLLYCINYNINYMQHYYCRLEFKVLFFIYGVNVGIRLYCTHKCRNKLFIIITENQKAKLFNTDD